ncbi:MAG: preQ(1) synthase [Proteobacteria bacterium]|nr:NADPH-dependent 7-cyano-7-deazaguanine reductase QueF [Desulfobacteraceae bacterium]MBU3979798.1 preQ(1) synthase [Pseudomonadota bacterium]MBU4012372.1 preQ(1) synthase [Pseudomonadota bacterium]MBU4068593.1 preQ(1) synthase [Pseudomonadota bacterium]MBU4101139.1 preQ(1) synthase [Pseudomonadota bacterium]
MSKTSEKRVTCNIKTPDTVKIDLITTIDYKYKEARDIDITIQQPEFTSVCPMTGLPDFGCITIRYTPNNKIVELKSLKFYMLQYRNVGIFYEHLVNNILNDLVEALDPKWMEITGNFTARGGITTKVAVEYNSA